jgi:membrane protease YdiL (CAAX protease family)
MFFHTNLGRAMSDPHHNLWADTALTPRLPQSDRSAIITIYDIVRFVLGVIGMVLGLGAVGGLLVGPDIGQLSDFANADPALSLWVLGLSYLGMGLMVLAAVKWGRSSVWRPLKLDRAPGKWLVLGPLLALAASFALDWGAVGLYQELTGDTIELEIDQFMRNGLDGPVMSAFMVLVAGILGPIVEELIFRGLALGWLQRLMPFWLAALISSVLFGLAHEQGPHIILAAVLGLVFAFLYRRAGSLWAPIAGHIVNNVAAVASVYFGF